ncbi:hypothetical protein [Pseudomonas aeruginosa]|uniref:hypothetical protein n=1 Tax=Pseudomonas aeruginosa TaxID=287 RepID=UPI0003BAFED6|nr:hypothetical protein [Pseudomonas aeruginosa]ERY85307.1 hypothetical protein Q022_05950 [Pseudomonas aeruginosa BWHPSA009]
MSLETTIAALVAAANNLTNAVNGKVSEIDTELATALAQFNTWKANFSTNINGLEVYKQGGIKRFFFGQNLDNGGYLSSGDGPDATFPYCAAPKAPWYINLLEFNGVKDPGAFGTAGDIFKADWIMSHRGIANGTYFDQLAFKGTSWADSVSGHVEVKNISQDGMLSLHISAPNTPDKVIPLTKAMMGTVIPVDFWAFGQGTAGKARISIKVDTRWHCGSGRAFSADVSYTSNLAGPCVARVTQTKPAWNA